MSDTPFRHLSPRSDLRDTFPPAEVATVRAAMLGSPTAVSAALVALELLELVAERAGTRVRPSAIEEATTLLRVATADGVDPQCSDEARRIAAWLEGAAEALREAPDEEDDNVRVMHESDIRSRLDLARYAIAEELDLELEWWDPEDQRWPRRRATPARVDDDPATLVIETLAGDLEIPMEDVRWMMPVERRDDAVRTRVGKVLEFPSFSSEEE